MRDALGRLRGGLGLAGTGAVVLARAGVVRPLGPVALARTGRTLLGWGTGPAGGFAAASALDPGRTAVVDELGSLTYAELHRRSNALARGLADLGVGEGDGVALLCRNHRGFVLAGIAAAKLGADQLYLNTASSGPQLREVLARERPAVVVLDAEFAPLLDTGAAGPADPADAAGRPARVLAWTETDRPPGRTLDELVAGCRDHDLAPPERHGRVVVLTSGTTGTPKGAPRPEAGLDAAVSLLSRLPLRYGWRSHVAAPLFHTWGFAHLALAMLLGTTLVLRRRFDPEDCLRVVEEERCDSLVVVPVMLQRILGLPEETLARHDLSRLRVVASSGSALPGDLATSWMDRFGDRLYNVYGSTEVAYASVATPADLRAAPGAAGKPPYATVVRILDGDGRAVPPGETGRIFVGNTLLFEGYSDGGGKEVVDGLMATGDVGRFDADGRLHVEGRDDDMVVTGGENVFPQEVEDCLMRHDAVLDAAVVGVPDPELGQRLRAFVVASRAVSAEELQEHVRSRLARFQVPREVVFVADLPRNATGKVVRRELDAD